MNLHVKHVHARMYTRSRAVVTYAEMIRSCDETITECLLRNCLPWQVALAAKHRITSKCYEMQCNVIFLSTKAVIRVYFI